MNVAIVSRSPWRVIADGETELEAGQAVIKSVMDGFTATSRFWKLQILRNHGAPESRLALVEFYGVDHTMKKFFTEHGFAQVCTACELCCRTGCAPPADRWRGNRINEICTMNLTIRTKI